MKIAVLGIGNMGSAILKGLANRFDKKDLYGENPVNPRVSVLQKKLGFQLVHTVNDLPTELDVVIVTLPVKVTLAVVKELKVSADTVILSAAGGVKISAVQAVSNQRAVAAMIPNIPVAVNAGTIGLSWGNINDQQKETVQTVLQSLGDVIIVKENQLGIVGTVGGCGPAFVDVFMDAMGDGAVENGLDRQTAYQVISSMVKGSGDLAYQTKMTPSDLKDQVTSPGGSTIKGVNQLAAYNFKNAIIKAINAANNEM